MTKEVIFGLLAVPVVGFLMWKLVNLKGLTETEFPQSDDATAPRARQ